MDYMKIDLILEIVRKYYVKLLCIRCIQTTYELLKKNINMFIKIDICLNNPLCQLS